MSRLLYGQSHAHLHVLRILLPLMPAPLRPIPSQSWSHGCPSATSLSLSVTNYGARSPRLPGCFVQGLPRRAEHVTTFALESIPIKKTSVVKVIDTCLLNTVLRNNVTYEREPSSYDIRIFAFSPLLINLTSTSHNKLRVAFD